MLNAFLLMNITNKNYLDYSTIFHNHLCFFSQSFGIYISYLKLFLSSCVYYSLHHFYPIPILNENTFIFFQIEYLKIRDMINTI